MAYLSPSELILNDDGSIYHLHLKPGQLAPNIILVGDPGRVSMVSSFFDSIEIKQQNREITSHTGCYKGMDISVVSTGMGVDNIDIVINEIDALFNIDLASRSLKPNPVSLNIIRIGTSGALQHGIEPNTTVVSSHGLGLDGMLYYYKNAHKAIEHEMTEQFAKISKWPDCLPTPYMVQASKDLLESIGDGFLQGITATAPGFYGPQGRILRLDTLLPDLNDLLKAFRYQHLNIVNFEMETSALYGFGKMLGHNTLTLTNIVANRMDGTYSKDYQKHITLLIQTVLDRMVMVAVN